MKIEPIIIKVTDIPKIKNEKKTKKTVKKKEITKNKNIKSKIKDANTEIIKEKEINQTENKIETKPKEEIKEKIITQVKKQLIPKKSIKEKNELKEFEKEEKEWSDGPIEENPETINELRKEAEEWRQGPAPSKNKPPETQYAFEPTPEEKEIMKNLKAERIEKEYLKPTLEEEQAMEELREPDIIKELKPTIEELNYLRTEIIKKEETDSFKRTKTGISGIDELTGGGIPQNKCVAVVGGPGTGKSILLMQFLVNGATKYNEPGIYITFEEEVAELRNNYKNFNFNIEELESKGLIKIVHYNPMRITRFIKNMDVTLRDLIKVMKAKRIVIDSLSAFTLLYENEGEQRESLFNLFSTLKEMGVTTLLSAESWREPTMLSKSGVIEFIADGVIMLYNLKIGDTRVRALEVLKMRGIKHESRISPFRITNDGIKVFPEEEVFGVKRKEIA